MMALSFSPINKDPYAGFVSRAGVFTHVITVVLASGGTVLR